LEIRSEKIKSKVRKGEKNKVKVCRRREIFGNSESTLRSGDGSFLVDQTLIFTILGDYNDNSDFHYADFCAAAQKLLCGDFDFCAAAAQKYPYVDHCSLLAVMFSLSCSLAVCVGLNRMLPNSIKIDRLEVWRKEIEELEELDRKDAATLAQGKTIGWVVYFQCLSMWIHQKL